MNTIPIEIKLIIHSLCGPLDFGSTLLAIKDLAEYYRACPWAIEAYKNQHLISVVEPTKRGYAKYTTLLGLIHGKHELIVNRLPTDIKYYIHRELKSCEVMGAYSNGPGSYPHISWKVKNNIALYSTWKHGKKEGLSECKENDVLISHSCYRNGRLHGLSRGWYASNGNRWFVNHYIDGVVVGDFWEWRINGQINSHLIYGIQYGKNQLKMRKWYYKSSNPKIQQIKLQRINDGQYNEFRRWGRDGRLETVDNFFDNKPHGTCICWWSDGMEIVNYDHGQLHGALILWQYRKIISNKFYIYGTEI